MTVSSIPQVKRRSDCGLPVAIAFYLVFVLLFPFTKLFGGGNLLLPAVLIFFNFFVFKAFFMLSPLLALLGLSVIGLLYLFFSVSSLAPDAWTSLRSVPAAFQQAAFIFLLPLAYLFFSSVLERFAESRQKLKRFAVTMVVSGLIAIVLQRLLLSTDRGLSVLSIAGTSFLPATVILGLTLLYALAGSVRDRFVVAMLFIIGSALSPFSQNYALALAGLALFLLPRRARLITLGYVASSLGVYYFLADNLSIARIVDSNLFVRLVIIGDGFSGFLMTEGIGVGFGTESLSNTYAEVEGGKVFDEEQAGFIHISAHNSFATFAFRMGFLGVLAIGSLFTALWLKIPKSGGRRCDAERIIRGMAFLALYTVTFLNPGFESYLYLYGVGLYIVFITFPWVRLFPPLLNEEAME